MTRHDFMTELNAYLDDLGHFTRHITGLLEYRQAAEGALPADLQLIGGRNAENRWENLHSVDGAVEKVIAFLNRTCPRHRNSAGWLAPWAGRTTSPTMYSR